VAEVFWMHSKNICEQLSFITSASSPPIISTTQKRGEAFTNLFNAILPQARRVYKRGMSSAELGNLLLPPVDGRDNPKIDWQTTVNFIRKSVDALYDSIFS
jgi:hypothetical protein